MILDHFNDVKALYRSAYKEENEELKIEKFEIFINEQLPYQISFLEKLLEQQKSEYLAGDELSSINKKNLNFYEC